MSTDTRPIALIDFSNLWWQAWHSNGDAVSMARQRTREAIDRAAGTVPGALVAVCLDAGRSFRKEMLAEYKANRPEKDLAVVAEMDRCKQALREAGYTLASADGFEADDVIATLAAQAVEAGHEVAVFSADKDLLQLLGSPAVRQYRTHDWSEWRAANVTEEFGVEPEALGDWLALVGDASDNIKGAQGVGPKTATALLVKHGGLDLLLAKVNALHVHNGTGGVPQVETMTPAAKAIATPAVVNALWRDQTAITLARKLVALRTDAPVSLDDVLNPKEKPMPEKNVDDVIVEAQQTFDKTPTIEQVKTEPAPEVVETRAMVVAPVEYERQLEPTSSAGAIAMGKLLFRSRLYTRFGTEEAVTAVIIRGREMGLGALTALDSFHVVEGAPRPHAYLIVARAKAHPDCEYFQLVESSATSATWETKNRRNPKPTRHTYTIEMARAARLLEKEKSPWNTRPMEMLTKTAGAQLARFEYPDAALGLYAAEEMGAEQEAA